MSVTYCAIKWNRPRLIYDAIMLTGIGLYLALFVVAGNLLWPGSPPAPGRVLLTRALGTCAFLLLHIVLC